MQSKCIIKCFHLRPILLKSAQYISIYSTLHSLRGLVSATSEFGHKSRNFKSTTKILTYPDSACPELSSDIYMSSVPLKLRV